MHRQVGGDGADLGRERRGGEGVSEWHMGAAVNGQVASEKGLASQAGSDKATNGKLEQGFLE